MTNPTDNPPQDMMLAKPIIAEVEGLVGTTECPVCGLDFPHGHLPATAGPRQTYFTRLDQAERTADFYRTAYAHLRAHIEASK